MRVIPPLTINNTRLTSSTVSEPAAGETAWVSGTTYAVGDIVIRTSTHRQYIRLVAGAGTIAPETDTTNWADNGPTNKWAMFDLLRNSATQGATPLTVVITPGIRVNSIAIINSNAEQVTISATSVTGGGTVYSHTENQVARVTTGWLSYYFGTFSTKPSIVRFDLPPFLDLIITVTLSRTSGDVTCGVCVVGNYTDLGRVEYNAISDVVNFSSVDRDLYGNASLIQRRNVPKTNQTLWLDKQYVNRLRVIRDTLNATPAVWSGLDDNNSESYFETLLIMGVYNTFSINLSFPDFAKIDLELQEI